MLSANNLLKPQDGKPVTIPSQDMVLGSYYLTIDRDTEPGAGKVFRQRGRGADGIQRGYRWHSRADQGTSVQGSKRQDRVRYRRR